MNLTEAKHNLFKALKEKPGSHTAFEVSLFLDLAADEDVKRLDKQSRARRGSYDPGAMETYSSAKMKCDTSTAWTSF